MDVLQQDNAVWRANVLCYNDPELHQPRLAHDEFDAYVEHVMDTLIPPAATPTASPWWPPSR